MQRTTQCVDDLPGKLLVGYCRWQQPQKLVELLLGGEGADLEERQQLFFDHCYDDGICRSFPPPTEYRRKVLKALHSAVEARGGVPLEKNAEALSETFGQDQDEGWGYKTFFYRRAGLPGGDQHRDDRITLRVSNDLLAGSTGCYQWEAGLLLGEFILSNPELFAGKACLELGSGAGLVGVCLHRVAAAMLTLTDSNQQALDNCEQNLRLNAAASSCRVEPLHWGETRPPWLQHRQEVILGADLIYDPGSVAALVLTISELLSDDGCVAFLGVCVRNPATHDAFLKEAKRATLRVEKVDTRAASAPFVFVDALADARACVTPFLLRLSKQ